MAKGGQEGKARQLPLNLPIEEVEVVPRKKDKAERTKEEEEAYLTKLRRIRWVTRDTRHD